VSGGIAELFLNLGTRSGCVVSITPHPVPIVQEAGWASEPVWIGAENLAPPGFHPRTFQPVASRYTDCAIPAPVMVRTGVKFRQPLTDLTSLGEVPSLNAA
jgi:hypothetical protein